MVCEVLMVLIMDFYIMLKYEIQQLKDNASGAIFDSITTKTFESILIPIPKPEEQKSIVEQFERFELEISNIVNDLKHRQKKDNHLKIIWNDN